MLTYNHNAKLPTLGHKNGIGGIEILQNGTPGKQIFRCLWTRMLKLRQGKVQVHASR